MSSSSTPTSNSILSKPFSSSSSSQFIYSSPPSYGDASSAVYSSTGSYFPLPFNLQKPGQQSVPEQQNHLISQYQNQYPQIPPPPTVAKIPTPQHVYPAPASVAAGMYSLPQYQQAQQLFQRDAQKITPEALESVKAALANSEIEHKAETKKKAIPRKAAGQSWEDPTLAEWPENDYRLFCGDLGNEVNDEVLSKAFSRFASFNMARGFDLFMMPAKGKLCIHCMISCQVVRDKRTGKTRGYGFVSFANPLDLALAMKEMNGKYVGNRPIKLRKSNWKERTDVEALEKQKNHTQKKPKLPKKSVLHK